MPGKAVVHAAAVAKLRGNPSEHGPAQGPRVPSCILGTYASAACVLHALAGVRGSEAVHVTAFASSRQFLKYLDRITEKTCRLEDWSAFLCTSLSLGAILALVAVRQADSRYGHKFLHFWQFP